MLKVEMNIHKKKIISENEKEPSKDTIKVHIKEIK